MGKIISSYAMYVSKFSVPNKREMKSNKNIALQKVDSSSLIFGKRKAGDNDKTDSLKSPFQMG